MSSRDPKLSYVGVTFHSKLVVDWLAQLRTIVVRCAARLRDLRPEYVAEGKRITRSLLVLITFTATGRDGRYWALDVWLNCVCVCVRVCVCSCVCSCVCVRIS